jgi:hypothetical protein
MKKIFLFAVLLTAFFIWLNRNESPVPSAANKNSAPTANAQITPRPVSEHDWAKRSLDHARAVTEQARNNQVESQQP